MMSLGEYIRQRREEEYDLSVREFAKQLGCSAAFVSDVELGRRNPSDKLLADMARLLGTTVEDLKAHDLRPPTEQMKRKIAKDPRIAMAFRTIADLPVEELLKLGNRPRKTKK